MGCMRRSLLLFVALCLALIASACAAAQETPETAPGALPSSGGSDSAPSGGKRSAPPEDPAPDFSVTTFEGETFVLGEQRGTPVVLNFWESW